MTVLSLAKLGWTGLVLAFGMGLGTQEVVVIFVVVLLVFGPKRIPEVANLIGKAMRQFRKASQEIQDSINQEILRSEREQRMAATQSPQTEAPASGGDVPETSHAEDGPLAMEYYADANDVEQDTEASSSNDDVKASEELESTGTTVEHGHEDDVKPQSEDTDKKSGDLAG